MVELVGSELAQLLSSNLVELELLGFSLIELVSSDLVEVVWWFDPWFEFVGRFDPWFQFAKWFDPWFEVVRWFDSGFQFVGRFDPGSGPEVFSELTSLVLVAVQAETPPGQFADQYCQYLRDQYCQYLRIYMISIVVIRLSASVLQYNSSSCSSITIVGELSLEGNLENVGKD